MKNILNASCARLHRVRNGLRCLPFGAAALALFTGAPAHANQVWFQQPAISLAGTFQVVKGPQPGVFCVVQHQPNPLAANQQDVPVTWNMANYTGVIMPTPRSPNQAGTVNRVGASGAQFYGNTIGINMNSADFSPTGTAGNLVGIMPDYLFPDAGHIPFAQPGTTLVYSIDMQVVSAKLTPPVGVSDYAGQAYVGLDMRFVDATHPNSPQIALTANAFAMHGAPPESVGFTTQGGGRILLRTSINPSSQFISTVPGTQPYQTQVWTGFRSFAIGMTAQNLSNGIAAIQADTDLLTSLGLTASSYSSNPADYVLVEVHLNSEINFAGPKPYAGGSVQMGLSVQNMMVQLQGTTP